MDGDGSGEVEYEEFALWWRDQGLHALYRKHDALGQGVPPSRLRPMLAEIGISMTAEEAKALGKALATQRPSSSESKSKRSPPTSAVPPPSSIAGARGHGCGAADDDEEEEEATEAKPYKPSTPLIGKPKVSRSPHREAGIELSSLLDWFATFDLRKDFDRFDQDGSGSIDVRELRALVKTQGVTLTKAQAKQVLCAPSSPTARHR